MSRAEPLPAGLRAVAVAAITLAIGALVMLVILP
jgi:hypothetical protein